MAEDDEQLHVPKVSQPRFSSAAEVFHREVQLLAESDILPCLFRRKFSKPSCSSSISGPLLRTPHRRQNAPEKSCSAGNETCSQQCLLNLIKLNDLRCDKASNGCH